jgi:hypothetical protein
MLFVRNDQGVADGDVWRAQLIDACNTPAETNWWCPIKREIAWGNLHETKATDARQNRRKA